MVWSHWRLRIASSGSVSTEKNDIDRGTLPDSRLGFQPPGVKVRISDVRISDEVRKSDRQRVQADLTALKDLYELVSLRMSEFRHIDSVLGI